MSDVHSVLENLCTVEGVTGAFLVDENGSMIDNVTQHAMDTEYITDVICSCVNSGNWIANFLDNAPLKQSYIEFKDSSLTLDLLKNGAILALLASSGANLGRIRLELRKTKKEVEDLVG